MPNYNSDGGKWTPAHEKAVNIKTGEVYDGPDREAQAAIKAAGGRMGRAASEDPENIMRARQLGITVEEFLSLGAPPKEVTEKVEEEKKSRVIDNNKSKSAPKQSAVKPQGGGTTISGGFGDAPSVR